MLLIINVKFYDEIWIRMICECTCLQWFYFKDIKCILM